jgi:hypothetical protein
VRGRAGGLEGTRGNCAGQTEATPMQILTLGHSRPSQRRFLAVAAGFTAIHHQTDLRGCPKKARCGARKVPERRNRYFSVHSGLPGAAGKPRRGGNQTRTARIPHEDTGSVPERGFSSVSLQSVPIFLPVLGARRGYRRKLLGMSVGTRFELFQRAGAVSPLW